MKDVLDKMMKFLGQLDFDEKPKTEDAFSVCQ